MNKIESFELPEKPFELGMFINGKTVRKKKTIMRYSPAHDVPVTQIPEGDEHDADQAIEVARKVFEKGHWSVMPSQQRADILYKAGDLIIENRETLAYLECLETGKPISQARAEIEASAGVWKYAAGSLRNLSGETRNNLGDDLFAMTIRQPIGVIGLITPWNFPFLILAERAPFILAAGCTLVVKPSESTSASTLKMAELLQSAGLPDGVFNVITGYGPKVGQRLLDSSLIDKVSFTGSTNVGKLAMQSAASSIKSLGLELGGKNPHIVFADADLDLAVDGVAFAMTFNAGQCCVGGSRLLVEKSIAHQFTELLIEKISKIKIGDPLNTDTQVGAMFNDNHMKKVLSFIESGKKEGGIIHSGGARISGDVFDNGYFISPTLVSGISANSKIATEEIFGPVLTQFSFENYDEVISLANTSIYGLSASIWTTNIDNALRAARDIVAGRVWINTTLDGGPELPIGGMKASGIGRDVGMMGIEEYTELKNITIRLNNKKRWISDS